MLQNLTFTIPIGIAVGAVLFVALARHARDRQARNALAVGSFGLGALVAYYLSSNSELAERVAGTVVGRSLGVLLLALGAAAIFWRRS